MEQFIKEQTEQMLHIQRVAYNEGWKAGYAARQKELEDKREKEMDEMARDSLMAEEIMENTDTLEEKAERLEGSPEYPLGGMIEPVDIEREN